ncbi:conserved Plasmodium protein, unknown function [Plasmodium gallinaceum]|uniref:Uncharacterized protein n=1 Tax=Plasmodium gallinaceum TaxID=5849 RepID=A0A1J1GVF4_PLAGA|nr:conserved Plasmodium protein, unknown function [Plasmodium gallinaceum]CRG96222.1 conserved Plasmodium protein, unknown function [Plasmodium gallinaceum]
MIILKYCTLAFLFYSILFNYLIFLTNGVSLNKQRNKENERFNIFSNINNLENRENNVKNNYDIEDYFYNDHKKRNIEDNTVTYYNKIKDKNNIYNEGIFYETNIADEDNNKYKKKDIFHNNEKKILTFSKNENVTSNHIYPSDIYLQSFNVKKKKKYVPLNNKYIESSNIELKNRLNYSLNPALTLVASRAVDGLLGGVNQHMQGPYALNPDGNNSPLSNPIVTPNLYPSPHMPPSNMAHGAPPPGPPPPPNISPPPPGTPAPPIAPSGPPGAIPPAPPNSIMYNSMGAPNSASPNTIGQNPNFNIHPTASNLRGDPGNVTSNEIVSITIGIVLSLFLFCFISGCLIKMCKPKKRRR